jgi:hypothetical protein
MSLLATSRPNAAFATLRQLVRPRVAVERCELCRALLGEAHQHLLEPPNRRLVCACDPCAILFENQAGTKYVRVPRRIRVLPDFCLTDAQWDALSIPINMVFFFEDSVANRIVALYPSPAGPTESLLPLDAWNDIAGANPVLREMAPDVEALMANRVARDCDGAAAEYFILPIDECFKLVGLIRRQWKGLSGGTEAWEAIAGFFDGLRQRASRPTAGARA